MLELSVPERCVTQFSFSGLACHRTCAVTCASTPEGSCFETVTVPWSELAMTRTSTCIYHFFVLSWYIFLNFYISQQGEDRRKSKVFLSGGQWKYLTFLNLFLQAIFYGVACLEDVLKRAKGQKDIKFITAFRDLLFTTLAFPISAFVFLSFWILFLYDRELVYPKALDGIFPVWLNHAMHTSILPFSLAEVILRPHCYPMKKKGLALLAAASLAYVSRVLWIYSETGTWVYPVFAKLSPVGLAAFFSLSYVFSVGIYLFGEKLNHWKWGDTMQPRKKRK
ncbi:androgen-dependent TFPI-regulating protein isoform X1 [Balaenoptera acutorostrata]|uniref:Androgen-dependent TFPI-regulating protein isoform X1 n=1 Tax=Balaenoptera acutorostrata TaxID=9767 RepID=A0A383ZFZ7_BALAC|nr:androgen-dependent TFPI-regulating protein isoform X1 [Balaenoptera acutorostrata]